MNLDSTVFLLGMLGGALAELLKWYQLRESPHYPSYAKKLIYWIITALMICAGGILAVVHGVDAAEPLLALNIGISAPLIIKGLASMTSRPAPSQAETRAIDASIMSFLAGR